MKIAELFVGLGVKGNDTANSALKGVKTGLGDVKSMGLETKAAILAVIYGLEQLMSQSAQMGTGLLNFATLTGISAKNLQQWQYAARQAGVSGDELAGNLKAVQNSMTNMLLGKGAPEGLKMVNDLVGFDKNKARDTLYVMQQLQKFMQQAPSDVGMQMGKSFGLSEGVMAAMKLNKFTQEIMNKAPVYSDREINSLNKVNVAWSNLGQRIQMAIGRETAKHGGTLLQDITKLADAVIKLGDAFAVLAEKTKFFQTLGEVFQGVANSIKVITEVMGLLEGKSPQKGDLLYTAPGKEMIPGLSGSPAGKAFAALFSDGSKIMREKIMGASSQSLAEKVAPPPIAVPWGTKSTPANDVKIQQTLNFHHDGKDAKKTGDSVHKAVKDAYRQMAVQGQGS